nr:unnamed protein product [Digitaria exilis]
MMGSRVAAALLRRGRDQASALVIPRLAPRGALAPSVPRVGSGSGGGGGCLLPPRLGSTGPFSSASRFASFHAFRSLAHKEPTSEYVQPRVSPYRLATHLTSAFVIYCGILWTALSVAMPDPPTGSMSWVNGAAKIRKLAIPVSAVVGITAISGAFVAGNDAGHAYNSFPKMGDTWIPEDVFSMEPFIRNFFENTSTVQLTHRILATTTLLSVGGLWLAARRIDMHPAVKSLIGSTLGMAALQVTLGISILLMYVSTSLGSAHQAGALTLLSLMILLTHTLRRPSPALLKSLATAVKAT